MRRKWYQKSRANLACVLVTAVALPQGGCAYKLLYHGSGTIKADTGVPLLNRQYKVELGPVDLTKPGHHEFQLCGMPRGTYFLVGRGRFLVGLLAEGKGHLPNPTVRLAVLRRGETLFESEAPLDRWQRMWLPMIYGIARSDKPVEWLVLPPRSDFKPRKFAKYQIMVDILDQAAPTENNNVKVAVVGPLMDTL